MKTELCFMDEFFLISKAVVMSDSLHDNQQRCEEHWKQFNKDIKSKQLTQGFDFVKYGVMMRGDRSMYYHCAIPSKGNYPIGYKLIHIPRGYYLKATYQGSFHELQQAIQSIFEQYLPEHNLKAAQQTVSFYEKYTSDFAYHSPHSIIEIFVPVQIQKENQGLMSIPAKTLLQGSGYKQGEYKNSWFGMDYNMNLYKGCCHGCIYCDSRSSCYKIEHFDIVRKKEQELQILEQELKRKKRKGTIGIGAMSDTYHPFEKQEHITQDALKLIERYGYGVGIDTKSILILRDIDIIARIAAQYPSIIKITITCADDHLSRILEPNAPVSSERFKIFDELDKHHIFAGILMMPILPFINDNEDNIKQIIYLAHLHHAKFIFPGFGVTLRDNQRDYFYYQLNRYFPGKQQLYEQRYHNTYSCDIPDARRIYQIFKKECEKYGILYRMRDIIHAYKKHTPNEQLQLLL